jgi:hypothetical protein
MRLRFLLCLWHGTHSTCVPSSSLHTRALLFQALPLLVFDHVSTTRGLESWIDVVYVICYLSRIGARDTALAHAAKRLFKSRFDIFRSLIWLDHSQITAKPLHHAMDVVGGMTRTVTL